MEQSERDGLRAARPRLRAAARWCSRRVDGEPDPAAEALRRLGVMRVATKYPRIAARLLRAHRPPGRDRRGQGLGRARAADRAGRGDRRPHRDRDDAARERPRRARGDRRRDGAADRQPGRAQAQGRGDRRACVERLRAALSASRLGGDPRRAADARARARARRATSVAERRRARSSTTCASDGDAALRALRRALRRAPTAPLRVAADELARGARRARPGGAGRARGGDRQRRARSPRPALGDDVEVALPQGQRSRCARCPVGRAAIYVPGGRAPYPSTVVMGVVTARAAGVEEVVVCAPGAHPVILAACALCGVDEVYAMGGAHAVAALAYGTETVAARRRDRRPGQPLRPGGQAPGLAATSGSTASPGRATSSCSRRRAPTRRSSRIDLPPRPSTAPGTVVVRRVSDDAALLDAIEHRRPGDAVARARRRARPRGRARVRRGVRARAPRARRRRAPRRSRRACARAGCAVRRARERDRVRRLRRRLEPHACRPAARRASPRGLGAAPLPPAHERGADRPGRRRARAAPARRSRGPRASTCTQRRWRYGRMARR